MAKLDHLSGHYIREAADARLAELVCPMLEAAHGGALDTAQRTLLAAAMPGLKQRVKNIKELADNAAFYFASRPIALSDKAVQALDASGRTLLTSLATMLDAHGDWSHDGVQDACKAYSEAHGLKLGAVMAPLRAAITGSHASPSMFEVMHLLGKEEVLARIRDVL